MCHECLQLLTKDVDPAYLGRLLAGLAQHYVSSRQDNVWHIACDFAYGLWDLLVRGWIIWDGWWQHAGAVDWVSSMACAVNLIAVGWPACKCVTDIIALLV